MDLFNNLIFGFGVAFSLQNLLYCLIGVTVGTLIGVLPGIGPLGTIAILLPITYGVSPVDDVKPGTITLADNEQNFLKADASAAAAVVVSFDARSAVKPLIRVKKTTMALAKMLAIFHPAKKPEPGIHPTAFIGRDVKQGTGVHIGPNAVVKDGATIGDGSVVDAGACVGEGVVIGADCFIHRNATLYRDIEQVNPASVMREFFANFLSGTTTLLLVIACLVSVVAAVGILVSIYNSVSARLREIAILRALGATRQRVLVLICVEAAMIGLLGAIAGVICAHLMAALASVYFDRTIGEGINWLSWDRWELLYLVAVVIVAAVAGLVPALKAYRVPVASNLVGE
jgi:ABC-type antimicrobial peptide transport system permease subunit